MNIVVFDIETEELAPRGELTDDNLCGMKISVACAFDYMTGEYSVYMDDNLGMLWHRLVNADLVTGFNINRFDLPILKCVTENEMGVCGAAPAELEVLNHQLAEIRRKTYDLYIEAKAGAKADTYDRGYNCDGVLRATWGAHMAKTGSGADAPKLWQSRKRGELVTYCLADVHRERLIFERCWQAGRLRALGYKNGTEAFPVLRPQQMLNQVPDDAILPFPLESPPPPAEPPSPPFQYTPRSASPSDVI